MCLLKGGSGGIGAHGAAGKGGGGGRVKGKPGTDGPCGAAAAAPVSAFDEDGWLEPEKSHIIQNKLNPVGLFGFLLSGRKRVNAHQMPAEPLCCSVEHQ